MQRRSIEYCGDPAIRLACSTTAELAETELYLFTSEIFVFGLVISGEEICPNLFSLQLFDRFIAIELGAAPLNIES